MKRLALAIGMLTLVSCAFNSHGSQKGEAVWRIVTVPAGARVYFPSSGMDLIAPADLIDVGPGEDVEISYDGFATFRGELRDLPQVASRTFRCELRSNR